MTSSPDDRAPASSTRSGYDVYQEVTAADPPRFPIYVAVWRGEAGGGMQLNVPPYVLDEAVDYFDTHPLVLDDGSVVEVRVMPAHGDSFFLDPIVRPDRDALPIDDAELVGLPLAEAAQRATARGWSVRAMERHAWRTDDLRHNRIDLDLDDGHVVVRVERG